MGEELAKFYEDNPFVLNIIKDLKVKHKAIGGVQTDSNGEGLLRLNRTTIDSKVFNKLYKSHIDLFDDFSKPATKVFTYILGECLEINKDYFFYSKRQCIKVKGLHVKSAERGLRELIDKKIIARSDMASKYWLNIGIVFNGDRTKVLNKKFKELVESNDINPKKDLKQINED